MSNESEESRGSSGLIASLRARIARYREQADHFTRLAEAEPVETIRDQWKTLARDYAYLASTLEPDGYSSRGAALYSTPRTSSVAGAD
jgi:hypothetical protein